MHYLAQWWLIGNWTSDNKLRFFNSSHPSAAYLWIIVSIDSDNGLSPIRRQAIIWTNAGLLSIGPLGTNFSEILIKTQHFYSRQCIWKYRLRDGGHFVQGDMSLSTHKIITYLT